MVNSANREALRGVAERVLDHLFEAFSSDQWADLLKAPLERAAQHGDQGLAQKLVEAGAEMGCALHKAVLAEHGDIANNLLENGALIDGKDTHGFTPLRVAARNGDAQMMRLLLLKGADKDELDAQGFSVLYATAERGHLSGVQVLLAAGTDVNIQCGGYLGEFALHAAVRQENVDVVRALVEHGSDVDAADKDGCTALHLSVRWGGVGTIHALVQAGANVQTRDKAGVTPLHDAVRDGRLWLVDMLVEAGANVQARDEAGITPLHHAASRTNQVAALALVKHGAEVNTKTDGGRHTPLHYASCHAGRQGTAQVVDVLLRWGADETIVNKDGKSPADIIGILTKEEGDRLAHDIERVQKLLANAPADRAWRRRGYLALCRAHPDRLQVREGGEKYDGLATRACSRAKLVAEETSTTGKGSGRSTLDAVHRGSWTVVARVLRLEEEGIFRSIVGYL